MSKTIPLRGKYSHLSTIVDDDVFEWASKIPWYGCKSHNGSIYVQGFIDGKRVTLHRLVLGESDKPATDHIDGDPLNNQRSNCRPSTMGENARNRKPHAGKLFKGVYRKGAGYDAAISVNGERYYLGRSKRLFDAVLAYDTASYVYHGEFARPNCENMTEAMADALAAEAVREIFDVQKRAL